MSGAPIPEAEQYKVYLDFLNGTRNMRDINKEYGPRGGLISTQLADLERAHQSFSRILEYLFNIADSSDASGYVLYDPRYRSFYNEAPYDILLRKPGADPDQMGPLEVSIMWHMSRNADAIRQQAEGTKLAIDFELMPDPIPLYALDKPEIQVPALLATGIDPQFLFQQMLIHQHHEAALYLFNNGTLEEKTRLADVNSLLSVQSFSSFSLDPGLLPDDYEARIQSGHEKVLRQSGYESVVAEPSASPNAPAATASVVVATTVPIPIPKPVEERVTQAVAPERASAPRRYEIKPGETLSALARRWKLPNYQMIAELNEISDPGRIRAGQVIDVPAEAQLADGEALILSGALPTAPAPDSDATVTTVPPAAATGSVTEISVAASKREYIIREGDTLSGLAKRWELNNFQEIYQHANNETIIGPNPNVLKPGHIIEIPPGANPPPADIAPRTFTGGLLQPNVNEMLTPRPSPSPVPTDAQTEMLASTKVAIRRFFRYTDDDYNFNDRAEIEQVLQAAGVAVTPDTIGYTNRDARRRGGDAYDFVTQAERDRLLDAVAEVTQDGLTYEEIAKVGEIFSSAKLTKDTIARDDVAGHLDAPARYEREEKIKHDLIASSIS